MKKENVERLEADLEKLGFYGNWGRSLRFQSASNVKEFSLSARIDFGSDKMSYQVFFERFRPESFEYRLSHFDAMLRKERVIPNLTINGVNTAELDKQMKTINWMDDYFNSLTGGREGTGPTDKNLDDRVQKILTNMFRLAHGGKDGEIMRLMFYQKYLIDTPFDAVVKLRDKLKNPYDARQSFDTAGHLKVTAKEAYNFLSGHAVCKPQLTHGMEEIIHPWFKINFQKKEPTGNFEMTTIPGSHRFDVKEALKNLLPKSAVDEQVIDKLTKALKEGDNVEMHVGGSDKKHGTMYLRADPEQNAINFQFSELLFIGKKDTLSFKILNDEMKEEILEAKNNTGLKNESGVAKPGSEKNDEQSTGQEEEIKTKFKR